MTRWISSAVVSVMSISGLTLSAEQGTVPAGPAAPALMQLAPGTPATPAERRIDTARNAIARDAKRADGWNELALALARRARETADPAYYEEAWAATERSLQVEPGNLEGRKLQVWILLGQHEFARAVETADEINRAVPDDVRVYGFLADGYVELGRYADAEKAAQWMLDMRPGNVPGLTRGAHLRELFGDHAGAVEFMDNAYQRIPASEIEDRAWILTQIAHVSLLTCRAESAERLLNEALALFPDYHYSLAQLAEVRSQQERLDDAVLLRQRHYHAAPHPENQYELGVVLQRAGRTAEAKAAWREFEVAARREMDGWDNANIELVYYYADHADQPGEALRIAQKEAARRQDVRTLEALAWALHKNGRASEALVPIEKALAIGIKQPVSSYHAGVIAAAAGETEKARRHLEESSASCGTSVVAKAAREMLRSLTVVR